MTPLEIKSIRKRLNLTQEAFAMVVGVSFVTINRWEKGLNPPSRLAVEKMNKLLKRTHDRTTVR